MNKQSLNINNERVKICFCSGKAVEMNCEECYWVSKEVKINNVDQQQQQKQQQQQQQQQHINKLNNFNNIYNYYNEDNNDYNNNDYNNDYNNNNYIYNCKGEEKEEIQTNEIIKKRYRKSAEICFCSFPAREINCENCRFSIPIDEEDNNNSSNYNTYCKDEDADFNSFINECSSAIINQDCMNQLKSFVL